MPWRSGRGLASAAADPASCLTVGRSLQFADTVRQSCHLMEIREEALEFIDADLADSYESHTRDRTTRTLAASYLEETRKVTHAGRTLCYSLS